MNLGSQEKREKILELGRTTELSVAKISKSVGCCSMFAWTVLVANGARGDLRFDRVRRKIIELGSDQNKRIGEISEAVGVSPVFAGEVLMAAGLARKHRGRPPAPTAPASGPKPLTPEERKQIQWVTIEEYAKDTDWDYSTVFKAMMRGEIPCRSFTGRRLYRIPLDREGYLCDRWTMPERKISHWETNEYVREKLFLKTNSLGRNVYKAQIDGLCCVAVDADGFPFMKGNSPPDFEAEVARLRVEIEDAKRRIWFAVVKAKRSGVLRKTEESWCERQDRFARARIEIERLRSTGELEHLNKSDIGHRVGISPSAVGRLMAKIGMAPRRSGTIRSTDFELLLKRAVELEDAGMTREQIAKKLGVGSAWVSANLRKIGREKRPDQSRLQLELRRQLMINLELKGFTRKQIAERVGISAAHISKVLTRMGIRRLAPKTRKAA